MSSQGGQFTLNGYVAGSGLVGASGASGAAGTSGGAPSCASCASGCDTAHCVGFGTQMVCGSPGLPGCGGGGGGGGAGGGGGGSGIALYVWDARVTVVNLCSQRGARWRRGARGRWRGRRFIERRGERRRRVLSHGLRIRRPRRWGGRVHADRPDGAWGAARRGRACGWPWRTRRRRGGGLIVRLFRRRSGHGRRDGDHDGSVCGCRRRGAPFGSGWSCVGELLSLRSEESSSRRASARYQCGLGSSPA